LIKGEIVLTIKNVEHLPGILSQHQLFPAEAQKQNMLGHNHEEGSFNKFGL
jgi:hypothetical protein